MWNSGEHTHFFSEQGAFKAQIILEKLEKEE